MYVSVPTCLDPCFHLPMCLDLCFLHALYYLPCACVLHAMFVCLDLGYVCHAMCYCSHFVAFVSLSCVLAYLFGLDLDPSLCHHPYTLAHIKGFGLSLFSCLCLRVYMLYAYVSLSSFRL